MLLKPLFSSGKISVIKTPVISIARQNSKSNAYCKIDGYIPNGAISPTTFYPIFERSIDGGSNWTVDNGSLDTLISGSNYPVSKVSSSLLYVKTALYRIRYYDTYGNIYSPYSSNYTASYDLFDAGTMTLPDITVLPGSFAYVSTSHHDGIDWDTYTVDYVVSGSYPAGSFYNPHLEFTIYYEDFSHVIQSVSATVASWPTGTNTLIFEIPSSYGPTTATAIAEPI